LSKKVVKLADKKAVYCLKTEQSLSQNWSCLRLKLDVSTYRYKSVRKDYNELRAKITGVWMGIQIGALICNPVVYCYKEKAHI